MRISIPAVAIAEASKSVSLELIRHQGLECRPQNLKRGFSLLSAKTADHHKCQQIRDRFAAFTGITLLDFEVEFIEGTLDFPGVGYEGGALVAVELSPFEKSHEVDGYIAWILKTEIMELPVARFSPL